MFQTLSLSFFFKSAKCPSLFKQRCVLEKTYKFIKKDIKYNNSVKQRYIKNYIDVCNGLRKFPMVIFIILTHSLPAIGSEWVKHKWPDEMYGILQSIFLYGSFSQQVVSSYSEPEISTSALKYFTEGFFRHQLLFLLIKCNSCFKPTPTD